MSEPAASPIDPCARNTRETLDSLLDTILHYPERHAEIVTRIQNDFEQELAPLTIDMSGFTRTTHQHGIVAFLLMIRQMHRVCCPAIVEHGGSVIKTEADNLFCMFPDVNSALAAAQDIVQRLETVNVLLPDDRRLYASVGIGWGKILIIDGHDLFGDEVNLACKLSEDIAERNMILFTERAHERLDPGSNTVQRELSISGLSLRYFELQR